MEPHFNMTDEHFQQAFENATMDPILFSHEAHLRLAWIHINAFGIDFAIKNVTSQLMNYVTGLGMASKYNETVTIASVRAVYHFMLKSGSDNFKGFIGEFPMLKFNFKELLSQHYGFDVFTSEEARTSFLEPNLLPFD
jgi:hypothetical protein